MGQFPPIEDATPDPCDRLAGGHGFLFSVGIGGGETGSVYQFAYWRHAGLREHGFRTDLVDIALTALLGVRSDPGYTP